MGDRKMVQQAIEASITDIVGEVIDQVTVEIPVYRALARAQLQEAAIIATWGTRRLLQVWVDDGEFTVQDTETFRRIGTARAIDGRPLAAVLRAYRIGGLRVTRAVHEYGRDVLDIADIMAWATLWMSATDQLSEALYGGYSAASDRISGDRERALTDLLDDLLAGRQTMPAALGDRCRALGITLPDHVTLILSMARDRQRDINGFELTEIVEAADAAQAGTTSGTVTRAMSLCRVRGGLGIVVSPARDGSAFLDAVGDLPWRFCIIENQPLYDVPRSYRIAEDALIATGRGSLAEIQMLTAGDAEVLALVGARPDAAPDRVVRTVLGRLTEPRQRHLLDGLEAFLASRSAGEAAERAGIHAQTMQYRLRRVASVTTRDPRRAWDRFVLQVALTTLRLEEGRAG